MSDLVPLLQASIELIELQKLVASQAQQIALLKARLRLQDMRILRLTQLPTDENLPALLKRQA